MALENLDFKRPNWSHLGRTGWGEERRREEEEEEEKKRRREGLEIKPSKPKVWMLAFGMELVIFIWNYMGCMEFLSNCMVRSLLQT